MANPIQYTSRTFNTILADINSDSELINKPDWFKRLIAGLGDIFSMMLNAQANNSYLNTAFTRQAVSDLLALIAYELGEKKTSSGELVFYLDKTTTFPITIDKDNLVALIDSRISVSALRFESREDVTVTLSAESITNTDVDTTNNWLVVANTYVTGDKIVLSTVGTLPTPIDLNTEYWVIEVSGKIRLATSFQNAIDGIYINITVAGSGTFLITKYNFAATVYQQESKEIQSVGTSDGVTEFQEFVLPDIDIIRETLEVTINSDSYTLVDTLINSTSTDKHCKLIYNTDGSSKIQFGDGTYGIIPPAFEVFVTYAVGGGIISNIDTVNSINVYAGTSSSIVACTNRSTLTGGEDEESIEEAKINAPLALQTRDRFVTAEDGELLSLRYAGISQAKVNTNEYGVLSAQVVCVANGGGNLSTASKSDLEDYLISRTVLDSIDVRVEDLTFLTQNVNISVKVKSGFLFADIEDYIDLACRLFFSETGKEIYSDYVSNGIESAVDLINDIFSTSFTSLDYEQIEKLVVNLDYAVINEARYESDFVGYIDAFVNGVRYLTVTAPTFPISPGTDEITTIGTRSITEI